jgi:hypothetical protein
MITGIGPIHQVVDRPSENSGLSEVARKVLLIDSASDWRTHIINYLQNPSVRTDKNIRRTTFKYVLMSDELYRRTVDDVLLKCLGPDDAILAMAEVHEGICGTHQSAPKMKWLLRRSGFYHQALAFQRMGIGLYRRGSSFIIKRASVRVSRHRLLYQVD